MHGSEAGLDPTTSSTDALIAARECDTVYNPITGRPKVPSLTSPHSKRRRWHQSADGVRQPWVVNPYESYLVQKRCRISICCLHGRPDSTGDRGDEIDWLYWHTSCLPKDAVLHSCCTSRASMLIRAIAPQYPP